MHAYVINLEKSKERRERMKEILDKEKSLTYEFIQAVDGRCLSAKETEVLFNIQKSREVYAKDIMPGEIGCTLSHQKCYKFISEGTDEYALILEDDIVLKKSLSEVCSKISPYLENKEPKIILLSGWNWYFAKKNIGNDYSLAKVFSAFLTQSYCINKKAAELLLEERPFIRADDWRYIKGKGVKLFALLPHIVNQDWSGKTKSTIQEQKIDFLSGHLFQKLRIHTIGLFKKILKFVGCYESAE